MRSTVVASDFPVIRVVAAWGANRTAALVAGVFFAVALVWAFLALWPGTAPGVSWIPDTQYYYGAGERLNAGHDLYRYLAGDRRLTVDPFYFAGPFLYPPLIGVMWRPLALLPFEPVVFIWWIVGALALIGTTSWLIARGGLPVAIGVVLLCVPLSLTAWSGNVQAFLTPLVIGSWYFLRGRREGLAGAILGVATVMKLTPVFLCLWLLMTGRRRASLAAIVAGAVALAVSLVCAGFGSYIEYARVATTVTSVGGTEASLTGIARALGASETIRALITPAVAVVGVLGVVLLRQRRAAAWSFAVTAGVFASTVMNLTNVTLLLAAFVPWATENERLRSAESQVSE